MSGSARFGDPGDTADQDRPARNTTMFRRAEVPLAHSVYGLILTLATVGELIHHDVSANASVVWLPGASAVLVVAHLFSDVLARLAATQDDPSWSEVISIGHEDLSVGYGGDLGIDSDHLPSREPLPGGDRAVAQPLRGAEEGSVPGEHRWPTTCRALRTSGRRRRQRLASAKAPST